MKKTNRLIKLANNLDKKQCYACADLVTRMAQISYSPGAGGPADIAEVGRRGLEDSTRYFTGIPVKEPSLKGILDGLEKNDYTEWTPEKITEGIQRVIERTRSQTGLAGKPEQQSGGTYVNEYAALMGGEKGMRGLRIGPDGDKIIDFDPSQMGKDFWDVARYITPAMAIAKIVQQTIKTLKAYGKEIDQELKDREQERQNSPSGGP